MESNARSEGGVVHPAFEDLKAISVDKDGGRLKKSFSSLNRHNACYAKHALVGGITDFNSSEHML